MQDNHNDLLQFTAVTAKNRRSLLPWWIKVFIWIFLIFGVIVPIALILSLLGSPFVISLYGLETNEPSSLIGIMLLLIFSLKAIVAYGLWFGKKWAITLAIVDAIIGILICSYTMIIPSILPDQPNRTFAFRLELLLLIPYLIKGIKLKKVWESDLNTGGGGILKTIITNKNLRYPLSQKKRYIQLVFLKNH